MANLLFADLEIASGLLLDDLNQAPLDSLQHGNAALVLSAAAAQSHVAVWEQALDVDLELFASSQQEAVAPTTASVYIQSGSISLVMFVPSGRHEYLPAVIQAFTQTGTAQIVFTPTAIHLHIGGAMSGEHLQQADALIQLDPSSLHGYSYLADGIRLVFLFDEIGRFRAEQPTTGIQSFTPMYVRAISASLSCPDAWWTAGLGPQGNPVMVEIAMRRNGQRLGLASISSAIPRADFYEGQLNSAAYNELLQAAIDGEIEVELGGYRALQDRSLPFALDGQAILTVDLVP